MQDISTGISTGISTDTSTGISIHYIDFYIGMYIPFPVDIDFYIGNVSTGIYIDFLHLQDMYIYI